jgi:hypothetical protein
MHALIAILCLHLGLHCISRTLLALFSHQLGLKCVTAEFAQLRLYLGDGQVTHCDVFGSHPNKAVDGL